MVHEQWRPYLLVYRIAVLAVLLLSGGLLNGCSFQRVSAESLVDNGELQQDAFDYTTSVIPNEFIVSFKKYLSPEVRRSILGQSLGRVSYCVWNEIVRRNPVTAFPSDFSLIQITNNSARALTVLRSCRDIRGVSPQRKVTRILLKAAPSNTSKAEDDSAAPRCRPPNCNKVADQWLPRKLKRSGIEQSDQDGEENRNSRKLLLRVPRQITHEMQANVLWGKGHNGKGVRVAILDTGLRKDHPHFKNIKDRSDWTEETTLDDKLLGHGTFVAGVIGSQKECFGFAPEADLFIFRVFTTKQVSYTSWFLDAFNYAILKKIHVLNLSIGGPDFMDKPFVDKVWELTANNVVMVSAIGNDGPLYGTLNNPADQMDVIGVGGIGFNNHLAEFSSRGMTTWELPSGYGRVKPDIVSYGAGVRGSSINGGCASLSGTSVSSPVVAGAVTLLVSAVAEKKIEVSPASVKQSLLASAKRIQDANIFEQGHGKLDLLGAYKFLNSYVPHVTLSPSYVDLTECPYMWPYCSQPLFYGAMPIIVNATIINGMGVTGKLIGEPMWHPMKNGEYADVGFAFSPVLWPWSGYVAVYIAVSKQAFDWEGIVEGLVNVTIVSPPKGEEVSSRISSAVLPIKIKVVRPPPRSKRILWDQFHNLRYPSGYFPRDNLKMNKDPLDWNADHIHTNFKELYTYLRKEGYYIDVLGSPLTCFDAKQYGTLLLVDSEEEYFTEEITKLRHDFSANNLSVIVIGEWFNTAVMKKIKFYDENTRQWWVPDTGGANVPALNDLLAAWGVAFSDRVYYGDFQLMHHTVPYASGSSLAKFPLDGLVYHAPMLNSQITEVLHSVEEENKDVPVLGLYDPQHGQSGRLAVFGDSNCLDSAHMEADCFWLVKSMLEFVSSGTIAPDFRKELRRFQAKDSLTLPERPRVSNLHQHSKVLQNKVGATALRPLPPCPSLKWSPPEPINPNLLAPQEGFFPSRTLKVEVDKIADSTTLDTPYVPASRLLTVLPVFITMPFVIVFLCLALKHGLCNLKVTGLSQGSQSRSTNRRRFRRGNRMANV